MLKLSQIVAASDVDWIFVDLDADTADDEDDDISAAGDVDYVDGGGDDDNDDNNLGDDNCGSGGFGGFVRRGRWHLW